MKLRRHIFARSLACLLPLAGAACSIETARAQMGAQCIAAKDIAGTRVRDDRRIDYRMRGGAVLRNDLPAACRNLNYEGAFDYAGPKEQICAGDRIVVAFRAWMPGDPNGATCALGNFSAAETGN